MKSPYTVRTTLVREGSFKDAYRIESSNSIWNLFRHLEDDDRESFVAVLLDVKQKVIGINVVSTGTLDASLVHPREVFKAAVIASAAAVICVHNHPSGDATPSSEDHDITARLREAGRILGIPLLDHIVIGFQTHYSFNDHRLLV